MPSREFDDGNPEPRDTRAAWIAAINEWLAEWLAEQEEILDMEAEVWDRR